MFILQGFLRLWLSNSDLTEICNSNRNVLKENNQSPTDTGVLGPILMMTQEDVDIPALLSLGINN